MLSCQKSDFRLPESLHYLNCAYMAPLPRSVEDAGVGGLRRKRVPTEITPDTFFRESDALREAFAALVGVEDARRIAIVPSVSYGIANAAANLPVESGDRIVVAENQFPSNVYVWKRLAEERNAELRTVAAPAERDGRGRRWNERILEAIGPDTAVVALPHVHWTDGTRFQLDRIGDRVHEVGGALVVDGTQSVGALPFDRETIEADALVCAGYKWLLGPYALGTAYYGPRFGDGRPIEENWITRENSRDFNRLVDYADRYQQGSVRYDVGERSNFILVPMLRAAIDLLQSYHPERIQAYCRALTRPAVETLRSHGWQVEDPEHRSHHLFGIRAPAHVDVERVERRLSKRNVVVSTRGDAVRISPHVYNEPADVEALTAVLTG